MYFFYSQLKKSVKFLNIRFRRQLVKLIDFCLQMADSNTSNDEKQLIELKLVSLIHMIALRKSNFLLLLLL
jgi:hypothetical protein